MANLILPNLKMKKIPLLALALSISIFSNQPMKAQCRQLKTPAEARDFSEVSKYSEMVEYIHQLDKSSDILTVEKIGESVKGRDLFMLKFSNSDFGEDKGKIRVLIHAQQHGNEQSGKEGALLLAQELTKPENADIFKYMDLALIPQVNPDGSELNSRRNGNGMDLNRNHLIMTEPEVVALHKIFDKYQFEVTMDVHEYYPYGETWKNFGYRTNSDILVGFNTHPSIPESIRQYQQKKIKPYYSAFLTSRGVSNAMYSPGGPPERDYIRYSTFDINDGRQSYGIQNTFSFIQEGMNGVDALVDNLEHRSRSQFFGMLALLRFVYENHSEMKALVAKERRIENIAVSELPLQMEHFPDGTRLELPVYSYASNRDSVIVVNDFRPVVKPTMTISRPCGYLFPKSHQDLIDWAFRHGLKVKPLKKDKNIMFEQLIINKIGSIDFERDTIAIPQVSVQKIEPKSINLEEYIFIPTSQLKGNMLITAIEPQSELGLATYSQFAYLMKAQSIYPVIRVRSSR